VQQLATASFCGAVWRRRSRWLLGWGAGTQPSQATLPRVTPAVPAGMRECHPHFVVLHRVRTAVYIATQRVAGCGLTRVGRPCRRRRRRRCTQPWPHTSRCRAPPLGDAQRVWMAAGAARHLPGERWPVPAFAAAAAALQPERGVPGCVRAPAILRARRCARAAGRGSLQPAAAPAAPSHNGACSGYRGLGGPSIIEQHTSGRGRGAAAAGLPGWHRAHQPAAAAGPTVPLRNTSIPTEVLA
jgi:hypothetical protein